VESPKIGSLTLPIYLPQVDDVLDYERHNPDHVDPDDVYEGMIVLHQPRQEGKDRVKIPKGDVLTAYVTATSELEAFPTLPEKGFGAKSLYGDWFIYHDNINLCERFVEKHPTITVTVSESIHVVELSAKAVKLELDSIKGYGKMSSRLTNSISMHISVNIPNGPLLRIINPQMVKHVWEGHGFRVLKHNRDGVKVEGSRVKGKGLEGSYLHMNIIHRDGQPAGAYYPPTLEVKIRQSEQPIHLEYKIFDSAHLTADMICASGCHRYKRGCCPPLFLPCTCGDSTAGPRTPDDGLAKLLAKVGASRGTTQCNYFLDGKCLYAGRGRKCPWAHNGKASEIECHLNSKCLTGKCEYKHQFDDLTMNDAECKPPPPSYTPKPAYQWEPD